VGRLFWKFFFFIWLAQLTSIWGVGSAIWLIRHNENQNLVGVDTSRPASYFVEAAASTLQYGGMEALKNLLKTESRRHVYAIDEAGQDILDRAVDPAMLESVKLAIKDAAPSQTIRQVSISGRTYLLFVPEMVGASTGFFQNRFASNASNATRRLQPHLYPVVPVVSGTLASLIFAYLLAWYFSKPIRNLRAAIESVADGNLNVALISTMGKRRDDLADLGRDFDYMADKLRGSIESQRRLLHDISHELRSPLARLQAAIGLLRQQPDNPEFSMERIERECVRMDRLVGELLTLSKLDAGATGSTQQTVSLKELLDDIVADARFEAKAQGKDVTVSCQCNAIIQGNIELLHHAIENVVRNAVKYAPIGSSVKIETWENPEHGKLRIAVLDEGPGVPESEMALIFEPFYRGNASEMRPDGHGLGLAIAYRAIKAHGGNISASNREAGGLRVEMTLPMLS
jgi:two-component system OmpR family sensor kinase